MVLRTVSPTLIMNRIHETLNSKPGDPPNKVSTDLATRACVMAALDVLAAHGFVIAVENRDPHAGDPIV